MAYPLAGTGLQMLTCFVVSPSLFHHILSKFDVDTNGFGGKDSAAKFLFEPVLIPDSVLILRDLLCNFESDVDM